MTAPREVMTCLAAGLLALGCYSEEVVFKEFCDADPKRAEWVRQCAEAANPKSDEEGEDLVAQCERSSRELLCPKRWVKQVCPPQGSCYEVPR